MRETTRKDVEDELRGWEEGLSRATPGTSVYQAIVARVEQLKKMLEKVKK